MAITNGLSRLNIGAFNRDRWLFYGKIGLAFFCFTVCSDLIIRDAPLTQKLLNHGWLILYLVGVNQFFYDHALARMGLKAVVRTLVLLGLQFFLLSFGLYLWRCIGLTIGIYTSFQENTTVSEDVCVNFPFGVASFFFFGLVKHVYDFVNLKATAQQLQIEKQAAELNFLKSQTNPHFLFNTLNNIYTLANEKSDLAPASILRLSGILRFMLYETGNDTVPVKHEIKIINDYIDLEKLRYDPSLRVVFNYEIRDLETPIPPLLLMPLVENAFKYGTSETRNEPFVEIFLSIHHQRLTFTIRNSTDKTLTDTPLVENIGLTNLRRQLSLQYTAYELSLKQTDGQFMANLLIDLNTHVKNNVHYR